MNNIAGSLNGRFPELSTEKLEILGLIINNACNLSCKHCYLQSPQLAPYLTSREWTELITSALNKLSPAILCFAGKEVFLNRKSVNILFKAIRLRNELQKEPQTEIGVVTNGTLLQPYWEELLDAAPDYIDVSVDGLPELHDQIRGRGAFEMLKPNLEWLSVNFPGNLWITHTLLANNRDTLPEFIQYFHSRFGVRKFSLGIYADLWYTDPQLKLEIEHCHELVDRIFPKLEEIALDAPVEISMDFNTNYQEIMDVFARGGWLNPVDMISSIEHPFDNGLTLSMHSSRIPIGLWRSVRVTPEGFWLAAEDIMEAKEYDRFAVSNVRDYHYDAEALYRAGLSSERFKEFARGISCLSGRLNQEFPLPFISETERVIL